MDRRRSLDVLRRRVRRRSERSLEDPVLELSLLELSDERLEPVSSLFNALAGALLSVELLSLVPGVVGVVVVDSVVLRRLLRRLRLGVSPSPSLGRPESKRRLPSGFGVGRGVMRARIREVLPAELLSYELPSSLELSRVELRVPERVEDESSAAIAGGSGPGPVSSTDRTLTLTRGVVPFRLFCRVIVSATLVDCETALNPLDGLGTTSSSNSLALNTYLPNE